ncbi:MAG: tripartite tricarboxylate transporter substrate binding protein [Negativicutes bacterium]|nr:tripartite tricarboxylate transporter substrate binding protein [Negativicutes bacterium]
MKKYFSAIILLLISLTVLTGCGGKEPAKKDAYPNKPITLIVSYAAGGGTDLGARLLAPHLEKELGVPVVIVNKPGGGGWVGWSEMLKSQPDGYTLAYVNAPAVFAGYLNPSAKRKENIDNFNLIINHVYDPGIIAVRADDKRFTDMQDLIEYARKNELTATINGVGSEPHLAALQINQQLGTKLKPVQFAGNSEALVNVLGGHIDVLLVKVGEALQPAKEGQIRILAVMVPKRVSQLPDVPTFKEATGADIQYHSFRGIAGPKDIDPQIVTKLQTAFEKAMKNPEHIKKMQEMGLEIDGTKGEAYKQMLKKEEATMNSLKSLLGW